MGCFVGFSEALEIVGCLNIVNVNLFGLSIRIDNFGGFDLFNWCFNDNRLLCYDLTNLGRIIESNFILIGILNIFIKAASIQNMNYTDCRDPTV